MWGQLKKIYLDSFHIPHSIEQERVRGCMRQTERVGGRGREREKITELTGLPQANTLC